MRATPFVPMALLALAACGPRDADVRIARARAETRMLSQQLERLEDRMLATQARVQLWKELRARHESVAAIACAVQGEHAEAMAAHRAAPEPALAARAGRAGGAARLTAAVAGPAKPLIRQSGQR